MKLPGAVDDDDAASAIPSPWTLGRAADMAEHGTAVLRDITRTIVARDPSSSSSPNNNNNNNDCPPGNNSARCQRPVSGSTETLPIVLGVVIPISCAILVFIYLHRRNRKRQALEDLNDPHKSLDFGLDIGDRPTDKRKSRRGLRVGRKDAPEMAITEMNEQAIRKQARGLSMDMLGSPYMLPSGFGDSHDSLHSMPRSMRDEHDPYRSVIMGRSSNDTSRSPRPFNDKASFYSASTTHTGYNDKSNLVVNAQRMSQSYPSRHTSSSQLSTRPEPEASLPALPADAALMITKSREGSPDSADPQSPGPVAAEADLPPIPPPKGESEELDSFPVPPELPAEAHHEPSTQLPAVVRRPLRTSSVYGPPPPPPRKSSMAIDTAITEDRPPSVLSYYAENDTAPPAPENGTEPDVQPAPEFNFVQEHYEDYYQPHDEDLGYDIDPSMIYTGRHSIDGGEDLSTQQNRLSYMGMRPLPPDHPEEAPEQRANRIRSFYKEYFDGNRVTQAPPQGYYEDFDAGYNDYYYGDGWYDPETGAYYEAPQAPYAQPVGRRAMTPPPRRGPRFAGAHAYDRHFSSMSDRGRGPHGFRGRPPPKKKLPPPKALTSLPTPHMLKSDSALLTSIDFAPPTSFREVQNGRGRDSPTGTPRPFAPSVRAYSPLASPFEALSPMPSPHQLRKSGTFTSLDFSPQVPRFMGREGTGSDAGSVRSARSGMSALQSHAVRSGAYRVSRIPKEYVTSKEDLSRQLRPKMDLTSYA